PEPRRRARQALRIARRVRLCDDPARVPDRAAADHAREATVRPQGGAFAPEPSPTAIWLIPVASVMVGSLITIVPLIATFPVLPPLGLMTLLAWRLLRPEWMRIWSPLPFGFFDDLVSGQPLGSAILLWT